MSEQAIEIEFTPTPEDVVAVRVQAAKGYDSAQMRRVARQRAVVGALVGVPIGGFAVLGLYVVVMMISRGVAPKPGLWVALAVFGIFWATQLLRAATAEPWKGASGRRLERMVRRTVDTTNLTSNLIRIDEQGTSHECDGIVIHVPWCAIERVHHTDGAWYFHASNQTVLRVPDRVVPHGEALRALIGERVREGGA